MADSAAQGYGIGAAVGGAAATVGAVAAPAAAAATAFGISTAIGTAIPIPLIGTAIGAIVGAFTALGIAVANGFRDTFHPNAHVAASWLLLFQIAPGLVYSGIDNINTETGSSDRPAEVYAGRLVRYFRLVSGIVPNPSGILYNPRNDNYKALPTDAPKTNDYIESTVTDPGEPLTDVATLKRIGDLVRARRRPADPRVPSQLKTPAQARAALSCLRGKHFADSGILSWNQLTEPHTAADLRAAVARVRALAGEHGPDAYLAQLLGGNVTPHPAQPDPRLAGASDPAPLVTPGRVAAVAAVLVLGGVVWTLTRKHR